MLPEEKARIDKALEMAQGNRKAAASALGMDPEKLRFILHNNDDLKAKWTKARASTAKEPQGGLVRVPKVQMTPEKTPEEIEAALQAEDERLKGGLEGLSSILSGKDKEIARDLHSFQVRRHQSAMETISGCNTALTIKLTQQAALMMDKLNELISKNKGPTQSKEDGTSEAAFYMKAIPVYCETIRKQQEIVEKHQQAKAIIELKKQEGSKPAARKAKPGFSPLVAMKVTGNVEMKDAS